MLKQKKCLIISHEIYGINEHIKNVCEKFESQGFEVVCPNLLNQEKAFHYTEEEKAYRNYMDEIGFDQAFEVVKSIVHDKKNQNMKFFILGFSVGATVAWRCSELEVDGVVGYYGSRIRDYINVIPKCPTLLFFPTIEKSFNIEELVLHLRESNAKIRVCNGAHGFTDPSSPFYDEGLTQSIMEETLRFFEGN